MGLAQAQVEVGPGSSSVGPRGQLVQLQGRAQKWYEPSVPLLTHPSVPTLSFGPGFPLRLSVFHIPVCVVTPLIPSP